jgi:ribosomal protein S18 acetylase RimI-like enzyme
MRIWHPSNKEEVEQARKLIMSNGIWVSINSYPEALATLNNKLVGCIFVESSHGNPHEAWLALAVDEAYRRRGIGSSLVEYVIGSLEVLSEDTATDVYAYAHCINGHGIRLFQGLDFEEVYRPNITGKLMVYRIYASEMKHNLFMQRKILKKERPHEGC